MADTSNSSGLQRLDEVDTRDRRRLIARTIATSVVSLAAIIVVYYVAPWNDDNTLAVVIRVVLSLVVVVVVTALAVQFVGRGEYPVLRVIEALAIVVGLAVTSFATSYVLLSNGDASAFSEPLSRTDALYFSLTTATTVGFGDIAAKSETARIVVMIQMVANVVVIGIAARVLVHAARRRADR